jgi:predicted transcriptional regulator
VIDTNALRGKIIERGLTQAKMAEIIGITPKTFYEKMKRGVFGSDEIETMIQTLRIEKPMEIFFAKKVSL